VLGAFDAGELDAAIALRHDAKRRDGEVLFEEQFSGMGAPDFNRRPRLRRPPDVLIRLLPLAR
jgi:hypothetical protein